MAFEGVFGQAVGNLSNGTVGIQIPFLSTLAKTLGGVAAIYVAYLIINVILSIRKNREIKRMRILLEGIDKKLSKK